jgi:hypothetical protein
VRFRDRPRIGFTLSATNVKRFALIISLTFCGLNFSIFLEDEQPEKKVDENKAITKMIKSPQIFFVFMAFYFLK